MTKICLYLAFKATCIYWFLAFFSIYFESISYIKGESMNEWIFLLVHSSDICNDQVSKDKSRSEELLWISWMGCRGSGNQAIICYFPRSSLGDWIRNRAAGGVRLDPNTAPQTAYSSLKMWSWIAKVLHIYSQC